MFLTFMGCLNDQKCDDGGGHDDDYDGELDCSTVLVL